MAIKPFAVPNSILITPTGADQVVSVVKGASAQTADLQQWQNSSNTSLARLYSDGSFSGVNATFSGDIAVNGGDITTTTSTFNIAASNASTINIGGASSTTVIAGNLTVNGTTTTVNSTTISVDDKNIELGSVASPDDTTAAGGGITLKGATDKTITWNTNNWTSSENFNVNTGKTYKIAGTDVLSATTLGAGVTTSSLTSVGTIANGTWQGTRITTTYTDAKVSGIISTNGTITVGGTTIQPSIDLTTVSQGAGGSFVKVTLDSYGRVTQNTAVTSADITGVLGYTPANSGSALSGTGSANKIAYWNGSTDLTYDNELAYNSSTDALQIAHANIKGSTSEVTVGTTVTDIDIFGTGVYRSAKYLIQARNSGSTAWQVSEVLLIHDSTSNAWITEYGLMYTGASPLITSYSADISAGNARIRAIAASAGTVVRFTRISMAS